MNNIEHVIIVGGTSGIGKTIKETFVKNHYIVSVIGRKKIKNDSNNFSCNILNWEKTKETLQKIINKHGKINHIVFCQRFRGDSDSWKGNLDTTLTAVRNIIEWAKNRFANSGSKSIVLISSIVSQFIVEEQPVEYHVAKTGLIGLMRYYAVQLGPLGIHINCISPGTTIKEESKNFYLSNLPLQRLYKQIIPLGRLGHALDIAKLTNFLCSNDSEYITGQNIIIDGGLSLQGHESLARKLSDLRHPNTRK